ncbi:GNAT family N-acetyltransferase [Desulfurococcaceae archaeon MEX13E-LK6-19]|nr:GNAT family N-acetyltransferase [Desulfurococcaceae archaeon MEX13E-LK6-19]
MQNTLRVIETSNTSIVQEIIESTMGPLHAYYAVECIKTRICRSIIVLHDNKPVATGVYYTVPIDTKTLTIIYYIAVEKEHQKQNIGKITVLSIEELTAQNTIAYMASTTIENKASIKMFKDLGYTVLILDDLYRRYNDMTINLLTKITCSHEDDVYLIKTIKPYTIRQILDSIKPGTAHRIWRQICYKPWVKLWRTKR